MVNYLDEIEKLDELAPKKYKFKKKAEETLVRGEFEQWQPKTSILRNLRLAGFGAGTYAGARGREPILYGAGALAALTTPKVYKKAIQAGEAIRPIKPTARLTKTLTKRLSDYLRENR